MSKSTKTRRKVHKIGSAEHIRQRASLVSSLMLLELLTVEQLAIVLNVDPSTARRELQKGALAGRAFKVGKQWRIRPEAVRALGPRFIESERKAG